METAGVRCLRYGVHFIYCDEKRLPGGAQEPRQLFVKRGQTGLAVDNQNEQRGFLDGYVRLAQDFLGNQRLIVRHEAARVDDFERAASPLPLAVNAVASDSRLVGDDGAARAGQTVEERGLAYVGTSSKEDDGENVGH